MEEHAARVGSVDVPDPTLPRAKAGEEVGRAAVDRVAQITTGGDLAELPGGGMQAGGMADHSLTPAARQAAIMRSQSATDSAIGFSQKTCLPAAAAARVCSHVQVVG